MNAWIAIVGAGVGSYLLRISLVALAGRGGLPVWLDRVTGFGMPAAFAALAAPAIVATSDVELGATFARIAAVAIGAWVAHRTRSPGLAITAGMPVLWLGLLATGAS